MATTNNPLDRFKSNPIASGEFKVPRLPSVKELVREHGLMEGLAKADLQFEEWRQNLERGLNERLTNI